MVDSWHRADPVAGDRRLRPSKAMPTPCRPNSADEGEEHGERENRESEARHLDDGNRRDPHSAVGSCLGVTVEGVSIWREGEIDDRDRDAAECAAQHDTDSGRDHRGGHA